MEAAINHDLRAGSGAQKLTRSSSEGGLGTSLADARLKLTTHVAPKRGDDAMTVAIIDERILLRECFAKSIAAVREDIAVLCFSTVTEWEKAVDDHSSVSLILLFHRSTASSRDLEALSKSQCGLPVVLMSDEEDAEAILKAIELGARGFIPASVNLRLAVVAMHLVRAGGIYVPECILRSSQRILNESDSSGTRQIHGLFTERQAAVVEALRQGKPNKIIAYELNMRESTVKVHIRNIMKKLNAKNRTEVAFIINNLLSEGAH